MGRPRIKWGEIETYFKRNGYEISHDGGDAIIKAPPGVSKGLRQQVRIGHTSCKNSGTEVLRCYVSAINAGFGIDLHAILGK